MNKNLTCDQVLSLINFYIAGDLNDRLKDYVENHISHCRNCKKKVEDLKRILIKYENIKDEIIKEHNEGILNPNFISSLSAYIDKELSPEDNIKIKKLTISNPSIRKQLEELYKYQKIIQSAYEKTKSGAKFDYSKGVIANVLNKNDYTTVYFNRLMILFSLLIISIVACFIYLYF